MPQGLSQSQEAPPARHTLSEEGLLASAIRITASRRPSSASSRGDLTARLLARRSAIEQAALTRVSGIADSSRASTTDSDEDLRAGVSVALDYALVIVERGEERAPPIPAALLAQARVTARSGVKLDTLLRRYFAGHTVVCDFLVEEVESGGLLADAELQLLLRAQAALCDRLLAAVSEEYARETRKLLASTEQRRADRVNRLLAGELIDTSGLAYDFKGHHLGAIAAGAGADEALRDLAVSLDCRLLAIRHSESTVWAWLGGRREVDHEHVDQTISRTWPAPVFLALGESSQDLSGWRLTHRQAKAALSIGLRSAQPVVRYVDVALLASMLQDELLAVSLQEIYLKPLEEERDGGEVARETLRAYFATARNVSSAAAALGVNRNTVASRLRAIETTLGRPLTSCATEFEAALRLAELCEPGALPADLARR